jgi:hypothetical protein
VYVCPVSAALHGIEIAEAAALQGCPNRLTICVYPLGREM